MAKQTEVVMLVFLPDGSSIVNYYNVPFPITGSTKLKDVSPTVSKPFAKVPKAQRELLMRSKLKDGAVSEDQSDTNDANGDQPEGGKDE